MNSDGQEVCLRLDNQDLINNHLADYDLFMGVVKESLDHSLNFTQRGEVQKYLRIFHGAKAAFNAVSLDQWLQVLSSVASLPAQTSESDTA